MSNGGSTLVARESLTFRHPRAGTQFHLSHGCPLTLGGLQLLIGFVAPSLWVRPVLSACDSMNFDQLLSLLIVSADTWNPTCRVLLAPKHQFLGGCLMLRILLSASMTSHKQAVMCMFVCIKKQLPGCSSGAAAGAAVS